MFLKILFIVFKVLNVDSLHLSLPIETAVNIRNAEKFVILAKSGITNVPQSGITGDIAVSPIASTAMTGFSLILDQSGRYSLSQQLGGGKAYAADYNVPIPAQLTVSVLDMESAYTNAASRINNNASRINIGLGQLGGVFGGAMYPLTPGVYTFGSGVTILDTLYLQGTNGKNSTNSTRYEDYEEDYEEDDDEDIFIIQITGNLVVSENKRIVLLDGVLAKNVFWQVSGNVKAMAGSHLVGILLVKTDVTFLTGSSLHGRVFTQTACNLQMAIIREPF
jgi:hypothetical protein